MNEQVETTASIIASLEAMTSFMRENGVEPTLMVMPHRQYRLMRREMQMRRVPYRRLLLKPRSLKVMRLK